MVYTAMNFQDFSLKESLARKKILYMRNVKRVGKKGRI